VPIFVLGFLAAATARSVVHPCSAVPEFLQHCVYQIPIRVSWVRESPMLVQWKPG
jgi:uncharacterized membrane protein YadS